MPGISSRYSWSQIAQLRLVEILSPSRLRNSLAGTLSGRLKEPSARSIAGKMMQWKTILSLPMKWIIRVSGSHHQVRQLSGSSSFVLDM